MLILQSLVRSVRVFGIDPIVRHRTLADFRVGGQFSHKLAEVAGLRQFHLGTAFSTQASGRVEGFIFTLAPVARFTAGLHGAGQIANTLAVTLTTPGSTPLAVLVAARRSAVALLATLASRAISSGAASLSHLLAA